MKKIIFLVAILFAVSCTQLEFYGDTFYTVQGKIVDANNNPISNFDLKVFGTKEIYVSPISGASEVEAVAAISKTDQNGFFRITFPKNNGFFVLQMQKDYIVKDSANSIYSLQRDLATIKIDKIRDYLYDFQSIKVLGKVLLNEYMVPFEFASILLLVAMMGVVLLSKKEKTIR